MIWWTDVNVWEFLTFPIYHHVSYPVLHKAVSEWWHWWGATEAIRGPRKTTLRDVKANDPSCCFTWREKGRQETEGWRSLKFRGQVFSLNIFRGYSLTHFLLLLPFHDSSSSISPQLMKDVEHQDRVQTNFQDSRKTVNLSQVFCSHLATPLE